MTQGRISRLGGVAVALCTAALLAACAAQQEAAKPARKVAEKKPTLTREEIVANRSLGLIAWMLEGTFDTIVQPPGYAVGGGDNTPMRLRVARLWPELGEEEYWFYLEYVDPADESKVIRQRLTHGVREGARAYMIDYGFPGDPKAFVGEWRKPKPFASVDPAKLKPMPGCRTYWLVQLDAVVSAGTDTDTCQGDGPPGTHEHADWWLGSNFLRHWFRQLDSAGNQVSGLSGPSEFRRVAQKPR